MQRVQQLKKLGRRAQKGFTLIERKRVPGTVSTM